MASSATREYPQSSLKITLALITFLKSIKDSITNSFGRKVNFAAAREIIVYRRVYVLAGM